MSWAEIVCLTLFFRHLWETDRSVLKSKKCPGNKTVCNESPKMSRQKSERNGKSAVAWGSTRVSMINLVDLAGSEKVLRQVYGSHTKLDPALCFALPQPWIKHIKWQSVITHEFEDAIRDSQWCFLCIPSNFLRWNRLGAEGERMKERRYDQQIFVPRCSSRAWADSNPSRWVEILVTTRSTLGNCIEKLAEKSTNPKKAGKWDVLEMLICVSTCFGILLLGGKHKCSEWSES